MLKMYILLGLTEIHVCFWISNRPYPIAYINKIWKI